MADEWLFLISVWPEPIIGPVKLAMGERVGKLEMAPMHRG